MSHVSWKRRQYLEHRALQLKGVVGQQGRRPMLHVSQRTFQSCANCGTSRVAVDDVGNSLSATTGAVLCEEPSGDVYMPEAFPHWQLLRRPLFVVDNNLRQQQRGTK